MEESNVADEKENAAGTGSAGTAEVEQGDPARRIEELEKENARIIKDNRRHSADAVRFRTERDEWKSKADVKEAEKQKEAQADPTPPDMPDAKLAHMTRQLEKERSERQALAEEFRKEKLERIDAAHEAAVSKLAAESGIVGLKSARLALKAATKLANDGQSLVHSYKDVETGEIVEIELTKENLEKSGILEAPHFPAKGHPGSGGKEPKSVNAGSGVDMSRVGDRKYWKENKEKVLASLEPQS